MVGRSLRQLGTGRVSLASIQRPVPSKGYEQTQRESWLRVAIFLHNYWLGKCSPRPFSIEVI